MDGVPMDNASLAWRVATYPFLGNREADENKVNFFLTAHALG
jgi:hypothetical protein